MTGHKLVAVGIQWPEYKHGVETWILWRCKCGCNKTRVEKIDGKWTGPQLGHNQLA